VLAGIGRRLPDSNSIDLSYSRLYNLLHTPRNKSASEIFRAFAIRSMLTNAFRGFPKTPGSDFVFTNAAGGRDHPQFA
jgi:hypothetical protein